MVLLDLQKAFNTVNHSILLNKLKSVGLNDKAVLYFESYLHNIFQRVDVEGVLPNRRTTFSGIPQGSILGPLLFLVYVHMNDIETA